jgi:hypothetical protein
MENGMMDAISDQTEYGVFGLSIGLICIEYFVISAMVPGRARGRAFSREFMK